jgi:hypothetical protein
MAFAGIIFGQRGFQKRIQVGLELFQAGFALKGLVETEEGENDVRLHLGQPIVGRTEIRGAMAQRHFIGGHGQIAKNQIAVRILGIKISLQPAGMLEAVGQSIADDGDMVAGFEFGRWRLLAAHERRYWQ